MDRFIQVLKANDFYWQFFSCLFLAFLCAVFNSWIYGIVIIFGIMVLEDFFYQTVDIRLFAFLLCLMIEHCEDIKEFMILFAIGLVFFRSIFLFSARTIPKENNMGISSDNANFCPVAFLPLLALSILIWQLIQGYLDKLESLKIIKELGFEFYIIFIFLWVIAEVYHRKKIYFAKIHENEIIYGFGDGDVFVCASLFAFLGFKDFFVVFFLANIIPLLYYGGKYFVEKVVK